jgi:thioredoxin reductase
MSSYLAHRIQETANIEVLFDTTVRRMSGDRPGLFSAGDVRSGSIKRIASAVGEGAMAVQFVHEYMKDM